MNEIHKPILDIQSDLKIQQLEKLSNDEFMKQLSTDKKRYQVNSDFLLREVVGEYLLIPTGNSTDSINGMISLNETFQFIWKQFQNPHTIYEVVLIALEEYEDTDGRIAKDIYRFVVESLNLKFIREGE